jgi:endonuclease/exonuclease/phosphatase family metal-dependent hydrolase
MMASLTKPGTIFSRMLNYVLPTLTLALGLQLLHSFVPSVSWYLRDVKMVGTFGLLPYAFAPFIVALFAGVLRRLMGSRLSIWITAGGSALLRLIEQVSRNSEMDLWLSIAGLTLVFMFLPIFIGHTRSLGAHSSHRWVFGFVLGFAVELSLRALYGFRPISSVAGFVPDIIVALLSLSVFIALWREPFKANEKDSEVQWGSAISIAIFGPFTLLQVFMFGSPGYLGEVASLSPVLSFGIVMLGYFAACVGIYLGYTNPHALHPALAIIFAAFFGVSSYLADRSGWSFLFILILTQTYAGYGLALTGIANTKAVRTGISRTTIMYGVGMISFLVLLFGYYVAQDIALPFPRTMFPTAAGVITGLLILQATVHVRSRAVTSSRYAAAPIAALALLLVPIGNWALADKHPDFKETSVKNVRVMTYNIHSGFNVHGQGDLEAIAQVIESSGADVIGLQEVSRGRFMDGSMDMPYWLAQRLDMTYLFRGTEEPVWGNALLSRYPVVEWGWGDLPRAGKLIGRGYLWARLDVGESEPLTVIVTHLHHLVPDSQARQEQVVDLLQFWNGEGYSIVLGDLNAEPGSPEMELILEAGLNDAWALAGDGDGYSYSSLDPQKRIDWLWHTDDIRPIEIEVIQTQASDHMPVQALFSVK